MFKLSVHQFLYKWTAALVVFAFALGASGAQPATAASPGTVVAWGLNRDGQSSVPAGLSGVTAIAASLAHSLALKNDGTVVAWGSNNYGQSNIPAGLSDVTAIAASYNHSLALKNDGTVVAWGDNSFGGSDVPAGLRDVTAIAAGGYHSLALKSDGTVVAWGFNSSGISDVPAGLSDVIAIAAGSFHSLALLSSPSDTTVPTITITTPAEGAAYTLGQIVNADYACQDEEGGSGLASCVGAVASGSSIDTSSLGAKSFTVNAADNAGNPASLTYYYSVVDSTAPTIMITTPAENAVYTLGQAINVDYVCQDEDGGSGLASCVGTVATGSPMDTSSVGAKSFTVDAADNAGNSASVTHNYSVAYNFSGFSQPVDSLPMVNTVKAGVGVPIKFSLSGNQGLNILAEGYPRIEFSACTGGSADAVETTITTGNSSLSYDPSTNQYTYIWKTDKAWANKCGTLQLKFIDGTTQSILFKFSK